MRDTQQMRILSSQVIKKVTHNSMVKDYISGIGQAMDISPIPLNNCFISDDNIALSYDLGVLSQDCKVVVEDMYVSMWHHAQQCPGQHKSKVIGYDTAKAGSKEKA